MLDRIKEHYRYVTRFCPKCRWSFQCPVEQITTRVYCRACE